MGLKTGASVYWSLVFESAMLSGKHATGTLSIPDKRTINPKKK